MTTDTPRLALYHSEYCGYCHRVRAVIKDLGLDIELRDIDSDPANRRDLVAGGGRQMVPCLRIEHADGRVEWQYESRDIARRLREDLSAGPRGS